jgi:hypothetical protein
MHQIKVTPARVHTEGSLYGNNSFFFPPTRHLHTIWVMLLFMLMGWDYVSEIAATNRPIVHPSGHISVRRAMVEWYWQGKSDELGEMPVPATLCPPQIPDGLTWAQTLASTVRGWQLTAWAMARSWVILQTSLLFLSFFLCLPSFCLASFLNCCSYLELSLSSGQFPLTFMLIYHNVNWLAQRLTEQS